MVKTMRADSAITGGQRSATPTLRNEDVAVAFDEMAELLAISGDNPFRIRAYQRAAAAAAVVSCLLELTPRPPIACSG